MPKARYPVLIGMVASLFSHVACTENLLQVYSQSLDSDPVLKAAAARRQSSQEAKPQARALLLPRIQASVDQGYTFGVNGSPMRDDPYGTHAYVISLNQPIYNRANHVQQRLADATVKKADVDFRNAQNVLILNVSAGYFNVLASIDSLTFATAEKNALARQLEQANRRFEVGLATITDVYDAQARFDSAVSSEIGAINRLANSREALRKLTGIEYSKLNTLSERMPLAIPKPHDPKIWVQMALQYNLALRSAGLNVTQARENIALQKSGHYPTLDFNISRRDMRSNVSNLNSSQLSVTLNIPLYSGGAVSSRARQAAYDYEASRQNLENLQRDTVRIIRDAYRGLQTSISQIKALNQTRISTRSALKANQAGYEVGTRTIVDVLNAERNVFGAERDYAAARYAYIASYLNLKQAAGQLSEEDLNLINSWLGPSRSTLPDVVIATADNTTARGNAQGNTQNGKNATTRATVNE
ncbi:MAG: type I secretion protein TolC [Candidatus Contendobacter odensis]|uniref:Type I secretion protein TolC n=1 Tax=Candidatus Contendibacter odensensis TaxID=1400860 RepID=A0A2G6PFJ9_9GAMM|nr:MAG: type I secretion protein TolC [Candidatus Contendobacter odensis]